IATLLTIARALGDPGNPPTTRRVNAGVAGAALGPYLLNWASGAFLIGLLGAWLLSLVLLSKPEAVASAVRVLLVASFVALVLVLIFQDPRMHRYASQVLGLIGLVVLSGLVAVLGRYGFSSRAAIVGGLAIAVAAVGAGIWLWRPALSGDIATDLLRFTPDP